MAAKKRHVLEPGQIRLPPLVEPRRMGTDDDAGVAHGRITAAAQVLDPAFDESRLAGSVPEQRGADVEDERRRRIEPDLLAEVLA